MMMKVVIRPQANHDLVEICHGDKADGMLEQGNPHQPTEPDPPLIPAVHADDPTDAPEGESLSSEEQCEREQPTIHAFGHVLAGHVV